MSAQFQAQFAPVLEKLMTDPEALSKIPERDLSKILNEAKRIERDMPIGAEVKDENNIAILTAANKIKELRAKPAQDKERARELALEQKQANVLGVIEKNTRDFRKMERVRKLSELDKAAILSEGRRIYDKKISGATLTQGEEHVLDAANILKGRGATAFWGSAARVAQAAGAVSFIKQTYKELKEIFTKDAKIADKQAINPAYSERVSGALQQLGMSEQGAEAFQANVATFRTRLQFGQVSDQEMMAYANWLPDAYRALMSGASSAEVFMAARQNLAQLDGPTAMLAAQWAGMEDVLRTWGSTDADVAQAFGDANVRVYNEQRAHQAVRNRRRIEMAEQTVGSYASRFQTALAAGTAAAGTGAATGLAVGAAGGSVVPGVGTAAGAALLSAGGAVAGGVGGTVYDLIDTPGKPELPVSKPGSEGFGSRQGDIIINNTFQVDGEDVYKNQKRVPYNDTMMQNVGG